MANRGYDWMTGGNGFAKNLELAITMSIDDFAVTIFTIGNEGLETLSTFIYADARKGGLTPELRPQTFRFRSQAALPSAFPLPDRSR